MFRPTEQSRKNNTVVRKHLSDDLQFCIHKPSFSSSFRPLSSTPTIPLQQPPAYVHPDYKVAKDFLPTKVVIEYRPLAIVWVTGEAELFMPSLKSRIKYSEKDSCLNDFPRSALGMWNAHGMLLQKLYY